MYWFSADYHWGDGRLIKFCKRHPDTTECVIEDHVMKHNKRVRPSDTIYMLGDIVGWKGSTEVDDYELLKTILPRMNGKKFLIRGNHDKLADKDFIRVGFENVLSYLETCVSIPAGDGRNEYINVFMSHDPCHSVAFDDPYRIYLCGHLHNLAITIGKVINVGVDVNYGYPISLISVRDMAITKCGYLITKNDVI